MAVAAAGAAGAAAQAALRPFVSRYGASISWFPGHMTRASDAMVDVVRKCDVILEVRDARVPFSSANGLIDGIEFSLGIRRPRVVVFNKKDLANEQLEHRIIRAVETQGHVGICLAATQGSGRSHTGRLLNLVDRCLRSAPKAVMFKHAGACMLVAGIPNVGKSTLINAVRGSTQCVETKGAKTGAAPGVTRQTRALLVRKVPALYMFDSPGILPPRIGDLETGLRLVVTTALPETHVPWEAQAEFLHFYFCGLGSNRYAAALGLPRSSYAESETDLLLRDLAGVLDARLPGGAPDVDSAARHMVRCFQAGMLGRYTLDPVPA